MEISLFKHHYFVTASVREWLQVKKVYMFIHCRAKDVEKTVLSKLPKGADAVGIDTVTKLD